MITDDYQIMFEDYYTGDMITLGGDAEFCSVRFDAIGSADLRTSERELSSEDGIIFGYEYLGARKWTIQGSIKDGAAGVMGTPSSAWDSLSKLMRAWDYNQARKKAREVVPLYFKRPGRDIVIVYGRPERIDPDVSKSYAGYVSYSALFRQSDPKFYSDTTYETLMTISQPYVGGLLLTDSAFDSLSITNAFLAPLTTTATTARQGTVFHNGDVDTPLIITITGNVTNPTLKLLDESSNEMWSIAFDTTINSGESVTIDTRQWERTVIRNDGASLAGSIVGPRLGTIVIPPGGPYELTYSGSSTGGESTCLIVHRDAWAAI